MSKTFNLYCDESCHLENDHKPYMFLGSINVAYNQIKETTQRIKELKLKHNFFGEIKWSNVSNSKSQFYYDLLKYFFETELKFRLVGINKSKIKNNNYNQTYNDFYHKMYYALLNYKINTLYNYNVYLDIKDTNSANKVNKLKEILNIKYGVFRNVQNIRSHESILMQLTDFLMGAISYYNNDKDKKNETKIKLIDKIKNISNVDLNITNYNEKLNLFFIELT